MRNSNILKKKKKVGKLANQLYFKKKKVGERKV